MGGEEKEERDPIITTGEREKGREEIQYFY